MAAAVAVWSLVNGHQAISLVRWLRIRFNRLTQQHLLASGLRALRCRPAGVAVLAESSGSVNV